MNEKMTTLIGGRRVKVHFADGREEEILVRQLPVREYDRAFGLVEDEIALTALICARDITWIVGKLPEGEDGMLPESYELLQQTAQEVNAKGFFGYATRRSQKESAFKMQMLDAMKDMTPEQLAAAAAAGAQARSTSPTGSPASVPRPR